MYVPPGETVHRIDVPDALAEKAHRRPRLSPSAQAAASKAVREAASVEPNVNAVSETAPPAKPVQMVGVPTSVSGPSPRATRRTRRPRR